MKHFIRNKVLSNNLYHEILRSNSENDIKLCFKEGFVNVNKFLFHIISKYNIEEKTDAILIPDISYEKGEKLIKNILHMSNDVHSIEEHEFWLDKAVYESIKTAKCDLDSNKKRRKIKPNVKESLVENKKARKSIEIEEKNKNESSPSSKDSKNRDSFDGSNKAARYNLYYLCFYTK